MEDANVKKIQIRIQYTWYHDFIKLLEDFPIHGIYTIKIFGAMTPPHYLVEFWFKDPVSPEEGEKVKGSILKTLWDRDVIVDDVGSREFVKIGKTIESDEKIDVKKFLENNEEKTMKK